MKKPYLKLRRLTEDEGFGTDDLAVQAGINPRTLRNRFKAAETSGTWFWKEIIAVCRVLHIPQEKIGEYFFPEVEKGETHA